MADLVIKAVFCELLGFSIDFMYIHAVTLASSANMTEKQIGYMGVALMIPPNNELLLLMIGTIQKVIMMLY